MAALQREIKFYVMHPDDPKLLVRSSYNVKNPYAPDRYYQGWGNMRDMRHMWEIKDNTNRVQVLVYFKISALKFMKGCIVIAIICKFYGKFKLV